MQQSRRSLYRANVESVLETNPPQFAPQTKLLDAIATLNEYRQNARPSNYALIVAESKVLGIFTSENLLAAVNRVDLAATTIDRVMTRPILTLKRSQCENLGFVWSWLRQHNLQYATIVDEAEGLLGVITQESLLELFESSITSEAQELERFFTMTPTMLCVASLDGYFKQIDPAFSGLLGFSDTKLSAEPFINFVHPEDRAATLAELANLQLGKITVSFENRYRTSDATYRWFLWTAIPYLKAGAIYAVARELGDRVAAELLLQQEKDFTTAIFNTVGVAIAVLDREGRIIKFNRTCEEISGYTFAEVANRTLWDFLILPEEKAAVEEVFQRLLAEGIANHHENHWLAKDNCRHLISWSNTALFDERGRVEFIIATGIDVTEQRLMSDELEQQYRQAQLLAETTRKIQMSIDLDSILQTTVTEVQHLLACDRAMVVRLQENGTAKPVAEAVLPDLPSMLGYELTDPLLTDLYLPEYHRGEAVAIADITDETIPEEVKILLGQFAVRAKLVVPILSQNSLKGLLVAHQCSYCRQWQTNEIDLLQQLALRLGIALSQAQLLNNLEELVKERTAELTASNQQLQLEIAERKLTETALRENEQKLAGILDNADEAIISIDEYQRIQMFNHGAERIFGYQAYQVIGKHLDLLIARNFQEIHRKHIKNFGNSDRSSRSMTERNSNVFGRRKNGEEFPAEASISKLQLRNGILFTVMLKDITERQQAELTIRRSEEQLRLITDALPILIAYIDRQQRYRYNNLTYEHWFKRSRSEFLGLQIQEVLGESNYQKMLPYIQTVLSGQAVSFEIKIDRNNGSEHWVNATYIPDLEAGGEVKGFFAMVEDITERKAIEQMKSEFVSVASHEMRTPLTSIHGVLKLIAAGHLGDFSPRSREMIDIALRNTDRLICLLDDVLDLERMEFGRETLVKQYCNNVDLIEQAVAKMKAIAQQQEITLEMQITPLELWLDPDRILQTLTNLLSNAIKFSTSGSKILISSEPRDNLAIFQVRDWGRGIPTERLESIFERFQQVDASDSRQKGGTGLGLAICRHIIEKHGGTIHVDSQLGRGSTFYFTLPLGERG
jgi:PAS domain S-box-containing protein